MKSRNCIYLIIFCFWSLSGAASLAAIGAKTSDSTWLTEKLHVKTKNGLFKAEVHFEKINIAFTQRVIQILKTDALNLFDYFDHVPTWTVHFIVKDKGSANGSATIFPNNIITLHNHPPVGAGYLHSMDDWIQGLVLHELAHVLHLDQGRGLIAALIYVFGSYGKWTGIVPRWFTEGIATWAESEFTESGRLQSKMMDFEITSKFFDKSFCQTIDCLDDPGVYPHGRSAYWLGSRFLAYLENKKAGTIKCLIIENSDNIPFMLNSAFKTCIGKPAPLLFKIFRKVQVKKAIAQFKKLKLTKFVKNDLQKFTLPRKGRSINWQNDFQILGNNFTSIVYEDKKSYFEFYNLNNKKKTQFYHENSPLRVETQTSYSQQSKKYLLSLANHSSTTSRSSFSREWTVFNFRKGSYQDVHFNRAASYAFMLSSDEFVYLNFSNNKWNLYYRRQNKESSNEKYLYSFNELDEIFNPQIIDRYGKRWLTTKIYHPSRKATELAFTYESLQIKPKGNSKNKVSLKTELIHYHKKNFKFAGSCGGHDLFYNGEDITLSHPKGIKWNKGDQIRENYKLAFMKNVTKLKITSDKSMVLIDSDPHHSYLYQDICDSLVKKIQKTKMISSQTHNKSKHLHSNSGEKSKINYQLLDHYPNLDHFFPHYWTFLWTAGDNVDLYSAATSLSDPMARHSFGLEYNMYSGINKSAPKLSYNYNMDDFYFGVSYGELFSKSGFSTTSINNNKYQGAYLSYGLSLGVFSYTPTLSYDKSSITDFLSSRENTTSQFSQLLSYSAGKYYDFLQSFSLNYGVSNIDSNKSVTYLGHSGKIKLGFRLSRNFYSSLKSSYGKLDKTELASGIIYGGGHESYGLSRTHEFYGVSYSDAFGNEMVTGRVELGARVFEIYSGVGGLFPLYIKEIHVMAGAEFLKTDFIFLDKKYTNESVSSFYGGLKFKMTMAYALPFTLDVIYTQIESPSGTTIGKSLISISGGGIWQ